jgi:pimeloyl-ACP methyl ester carboxylesterase
MLAQPGVSATDQRQAEPIDSPVPPTTLQFTDLGENVWTVGPDTARDMFWPDVTPDRAAWAFERLRPQAYRVMIETSPLVAWPVAPTASIVCRDDRATNPDWVRTAARERLGVEAIELDGGHSPMLSRPDELAELLDSLARTTGP